MSSQKQLHALRAAIRCATAARQGDAAAAGRVYLLSREALAANVPPRLLLPVIAVARAAAAEGHFEGSGSPPEIAESGAVAAANGHLLERLGARLESAGSGGRPFLLGDAALLALLYDDLAAFPLRLVIAGLGGGGDGRGQLDLHLRLAGGRVAAAPLGLLSDSVRDGSGWRHGDHGWRLPGRELLLALLIARVGDPLALPDPPLWHHLAIALGTWHDTLDHQLVFDHGARFGLSAALRRGLAMLCYLLPELAPPASTRLPALSRIERSLAVPLASRKLVAVSLTPEPAGEAAWPLPLPSLQPS